jgi:hypothetical protein
MISVGDYCIRIGNEAGARERSILALYKDILKLTFPGGSGKRLLFALQIKGVAHA